MHPLIVTLDQLLRRRRADFHAKLRPGAAEATLDEVEAHFGHRLPPLLRELYRWRDGQEPREFSNFDPRHNMMFMPLAEVRDTVQVTRELRQSGDIDESTWSLAWLPFLSNGGGNHLCLDFSGVGDEPPVVYHDHEGPAGETISPSLERWLQALIDDYSGSTIAD